MNVPVLLVAFKRPHTTKRVIRKIALAKPEKLYIAVDGPRNMIEKKSVLLTIKIIESEINWPCEVKKNISKTNLGCRKRLSSAIKWFFDNEEFGIILEDDCLPSMDFFHFMEEMLIKYLNESRVGIISGDCYLPKIVRPTNSYYFSNYSHIWGWGSWRRFWEKYDVDIEKYPVFLKDKIIEKKLVDPIQILFWKRVFENVYNKKSDTWDHQVTFCMWSTDSYCLIPTKNLVTNIGFGKGSTRTTKNDIKLSIKCEKLDFPLKHPKNILNSRIFDSIVFYHHFFLNNISSAVLFNYFKSVFSK